MGFAISSFLVAVVLVQLLSVKLGLFPTNGWTGGWRYKVLPSFTLGLLPLALVTRLTRGALLEVLQEEYVTAARREASAAAASSRTPSATRSSRS